jgi:cytochrome c peroxidase
VRAVVLAVLAACGPSGRDEPVPTPPPTTPTNPDELTADELAQLRELSPRPPAPLDPTNTYSGFGPAANLGYQLFFDPAFSGAILADNEHGKAGETGKVSCHTCHDGPAMDDRRAAPDHLSIGTGRGTRNSPQLVDSVFYRWGNWGGRFDSQWSLALVALEKPEVMNGSRLAVVRVLFERYRDQWDAVFPPLDPALADTKRFPRSGKPKASGAEDGAWENMAAGDRAIVDRIYANFGKAIAAYLRLLVGKGAPFDRFVAGDREAISVGARRGIKLFLKHCKSCHGGPHFADHTFRALAVAQFGPDVPKSDLGRYDDIPTLLTSPWNANGTFSDDRKTGRLDGVERTEVQRGRFRTPTLRNIAVTAPYMHAGQFKTLANVVAFYNAGGGEVEGIVKDPELEPLKLSDQQQADLVELMKTLTDEPLPSSLTNPSPAATLEAALAGLRADKLAAAADVIAARIAQPRPKMKLTSEQGRFAANALKRLAVSPDIRALHAVMPRSTVELARAVRDRGVTTADADAIARYLVKMVAVLAFAALDKFDENHSHVIGRDWSDIDYTGEGMTWQSQQADWSPKGVTSFKRAAFIDAYFRGAERLPHWAKVYQPRGKLADVPKP